MVERMSRTPAFLDGGGPMGALIREHDWGATPLGSFETWPISLRSAVAMMIRTRQPAYIAWGPEQISLYNDGYIPFLGSKHPAGLGQPAAVLWSEIWDALEPLNAAVLAGEAQWFEDVPFTLAGRDREQSWFSFSYTPLVDDAGVVAGFYCGAIETTDRILAERRFREGEKSLRKLNDTLEQQVAERTQERDRLWRNTQDIQVIIDGAGVFEAVNPSFTTILGWSPEEVIGRSVFEFVIPDDEAVTDRALQHARTKTLPTVENRYRHKDGGFRWISWVAAPEDGLIYASGRNVTFEKEQAQALAERTEALQIAISRQRAMYDATRQLIGVLDLDGTLRDANRASLDAIGAKHGHVVGKPFAETPWFTGTPGMPDIVRGGIAAAGGGESIRTEMALKMPDGSTRIYDFGMSPVRDQAGRVVEIVPEATDITELRTAEEALRQSQKMEAVGQLTGGLAHDFNNLLAGISGSLELMQTRMQQGRLTDVDRYMTAAQGAAKRAAALTHRLLAFSRCQTLDPKPTDVNRLATGMHELVQRTVGPGIPVEVVGATNCWPALVDPPQLENALLNLCINARDAMPDGGTITIETANKWMDERAARQHDMPEGQYLSVCVTDTGTGMPPEVIARVFEPFFTTKPIGEGTGLGLSMIYGFA